MLGVSIPYSTIKIMFFGVFVKGLNMFQFLIVRLKFSIRVSQSIALYVSIPYSTIKISDSDHKTA